jgi:proteasome assembly chaperone (PAC2) family protein
VSDGLVWQERPRLRDPILVAAFEGWNDAGDAASGAADWLTGRTSSHRFAWVDSEEHVDYQSHRPTLHLVDGIASSVTWPATECFAVSFPERDLVVVRGVEPNVRWKSFCNAVLTVARDTGCEMVVTLGALLGDVPHTRAVRVTGTVTDPSLVSRLGLSPSRYEGPTGIVGVLHDSCRESGFTSASLWAPVPHYIATPPNPLCTRALLERFAALAGLMLDLRPFDALVAMWRAEVDQAISDNDEVKAYVSELESRIDHEAIELGTGPAGDVPRGDELVQELEQFLREQGEQDT